MSLYYQPSYALLLAGLLIAVVFGKIFEVILKKQVNLWSESRSAEVLEKLQGPKLLIPYVGICVGTLIFLVSGMMIFGVPPIFSLILAVVMTTITGVLLWIQLGNILLVLQEGGSQALDLDELGRR
ncbi:MAG: hypothetical protein AAGB01_11255 [Cyanobacteria bacterium P01_F01_bin.42]